MVGNYYKRNLPHYQPTGGEFFVTFRLTNSLPKNVIHALKQEFKQIKKTANQENLTGLNKKYFAHFDNLLDHSESGKNWLEKDIIAQIISKKLHDFDNEKFILICYCIMPNHVHLLFELLKRDESRSTYPVTNIMRLLKGSTAREANKVLGRKGAFWQHESYDHLVQKSEERERIIRYILANPVKAGLINNWDDWKWSYCKGDYFPLR